MGDDEARARTALAEMQGRISQGPRTALGLSEAASPEQVRAAFLALTKRFHPARFGRMPPDIQRLSNEVFLGIKSAHDTLIKGSAVRGMPIVQAEGSASVRATTPSGQQRPQPARTTSGSMPRPGPAATQPPATRPTTPTTPARPTTPTTPARPTTPTMPARPSPPGVSVNIRSGTPPRPATPSQADTREMPTQRMPTIFDERAALQRALDLINAKDWPTARQALHALAAKVPQSKPYRALLCFTRSREAQAAGRVDEAVLELQRALQLDPELAIAKQALAELQRRR